MSAPGDLTVKDLLQGHTINVVTAALWLRDLVRSTIPDASETVWPGWHGIGYRHPEAGYVCGIFPHESNVKLFFEYGADLPDPAHILTGSGRRGRSVAIDHPDQVPPARIIDLIDAAIDHRRA
ncbi:DUF1801 domain-containing protein [Kribbella catacumbae]|uniref:DUF1801 domain-containing protein n=1 Tax=Kribbella catacumbae TaxID=460086 RepID=UPI000370F723|nr:DUF1801 domain-containing protein [Kribbella catacumbae]